jgi:hypothetical protein
VLKVFEGEVSGDDPADATKGRTVVQRKLRGV